ncbi:MAG: hypothetical protein ACOY5C_02925 [Pseudomonadota bacterium]
MSTVDGLMEQAFEKPRDPSSPEYKAASAASDAFYAGTTEGHAIWRRMHDPD